MRIIGASNHTDHERQKEDFYATDPIATIKLCGLEDFNKDIWEPACGMGHISKVLAHHRAGLRRESLADYSRWQ